MDEATKTHVDDTALGPTGPRRGKILVLCDDTAVSRSLPETGQIVFGRAPECDVPIPHSSVSRRHAILHVGPPLCLEDLGSSNGTFVRGQRIAPNAPVALSPGDVVEIGAAKVLLELPVREAQRASGHQSGAGAETASFGGRVVRDPEMVRAVRQIELVAPTALSVVLVGETGVGKELAAEAVHRASRRAPGPFLRVNCAALPDALLESELFGYERGAFTGAQQPKRGLIEAAHGGTLFLDEVAELPLAAQAKLLRVLENREVLRVGAVTAREVDVRFVAATHHDLAARVSSGLFRQDLYFRLNGTTIVLPPLRARQDEIVPLAIELLTAAAAALGRPAPPLSADAIAVIRAHAWPGNVRELKNAVERAVALSQGGPILAEHLPPDLMSGVGPPPPATRPPAAQEPGRVLQDDLDALERQRILDALERSAGHQGRAAELLGISRRTLLNRLDAHGLPRPRKGLGPAKR